ncbi:MAG: LysE family transporter [Anaerolineae bacterium]
MIEFFIRGFTIGLNAGILPGPIQTYLAQTSLVYGWRRAIVGVFSPLVADIPVILLSVLVLSNVSDTVIRLLRIGGGVFILWLAFGSLRSIRAGVLIGEGAHVDVTLSRSRLFMRMVGINIFSPAPWLFWSTVNGPLLIEGWRQTPLAGLGFLFGFYGALMGMFALIVLAFGWLRGINPKVTRALMMAATALLILIGFSFILQGLGVLQ